MVCLPFKTSQFIVRHYCLLRHHFVDFQVDIHVRLHDAQSYSKQIWIQLPATVDDDITGTGYIW